MRKSLLILFLLFIIVSVSCGRDDKEIDALIEETTQKGADENNTSKEPEENSDEGNTIESENGEEDADGGEENTQDENTTEDKPDDNIDNSDDDIDVNTNTQEENEPNNATNDLDEDNSEARDNQEENDSSENLYDNSVHFKIERFSNNSKYHQSAAAYRDYAFFVTDKHTHFYMYNLKTKTMIYDLTYTTGNGIDFLGHTLYHCNQATFGNQFYEDGDPFPLLYVSQHAKGDKRYFVEAYRIFPKWDTSKNEYTSFSIELVQTIYFPPMNNENALGNINMAIDVETNEMYTYSRNNNAGQENTRKCMISCFDLPDVHEPEVFLNDSDIKFSFYSGCSAVYMQGGCIHNRTLYIAQGAKSVGYIYLNIVDLDQRKMVERLDFLDIGFTLEPEGCFFYDGNLIFGAANNLYLLVF